MHDDKKKNNKEKITTGPFHLPVEIDSELQMGRDNERLIITLLNPTNKKLQASVKLGVCLQPETKASINNQYHVFADIPETEINLGTHLLEPHTCTRIERNIPGGTGNRSDEINAVYRVTSSGDFKICKNTCEVICGLLEISVVGGSIFNPMEPGLEQGDPVTFFRYKDFVRCKDY
jgi:hypothetical protein